MKNYFAYGSNLMLDQMKERCTDNVKIGIGTLSGYRWIINTRGYANIVKSEGDYVLGMIYEISSNDEKTLDRKEGLK
jgi:gamma-glutamylcyclotransferase